MREENTMKVVGLGQCSLDLIVFADGFPVEDTKPEVKGLLTQGGGPVATALVALSRLKVKTSFMGVVADDDAGKEIKRGLRKEGVSIAGLKTRCNGTSQLAFIVVNKKTGARTILWKRPSVKELTSTEVEAKRIKGSKMLLLDGLMHRASLEAARIARGLGVPVLLDCGRLRKGTKELIKLSDYIVGSEELARDLSAEPWEALKKLRRLNPKARAVTITLGKKGSLTSTPTDTFRTPAFKVQAIDTTGAGDVFHAGFCFGLIRGWDLRRAATFASAFAALKCLRPGGRRGIPTLGRTLRFIKERGR